MNVGNEAVVASRALLAAAELVRHFVQGRSDSTERLEPERTREASRAGYAESVSGSVTCQGGQVGSDRAVDDDMPPTPPERQQR